MSYTAPIMDPALIDRDLRLDESRITLVIGPAGYGKTTLLSRWYRTLRRSGAHPVWLRIDSERIEPADLERFLHRSLCLVHTGLISEPIRAAIDAVGDADRVLFVDDVHHLGQHVIDQLLELFADTAGPPWRLVLAGRTTMAIVPPQDLSDATVRELGHEDLQLTDHEVDRVLRDVAPDLDHWQRAEVVDRISGWPVGLDLVSRILATDRSTAASTAERVDSHRIVADYFEREVLSRLALSDQDFLMWSSVVARPEGEICDQINRIGGSGDRLARLGRLNAFIRTAPDGTHQWTPMGRAFLLARLRALGSEHEGETRRLVLNRLLAQRRYDDAVTQAAETDDWLAVVDLVLETGLDIIGCGRAEDLISWLDQLPAEVVIAESGVAVLAAMALWVRHGDMAGDEIDRWLLQAVSTRRGRPPCQAESLSAAIDAARAAFGRLGPRTRKLVAERALRAEGAIETPWAALSYTAVGLAAYLDGEAREARRALTESLRIQTALEVEPRRCFARLFSPTALAVLALIELEGGGYDNRADALISVAELQSPRSPSSTPAAGIIRLAKSRSALAAGDHRRALELALETAETAQLISFQILGYLDAASINGEQGRAAASMRCLSEADRLLVGGVDPGQLLTKRRRAIERQIQLGRAARGSSIDLLTEREVEVLRLLDSDLSRREIARELYLSFETVKTYVQRLYQKLGVSSRAAAVSTARAWGWLEEVDEAELSSEVTVDSEVGSPSDGSDLTGDRPPAHVPLPVAISVAGIGPIRSYGLGRSEG